MLTLRPVALGLLASLAATLATAASDQFISVRAPADVSLDTNPTSEFWRAAKPVIIDTDNKGVRQSGFTMEVRTRWTPENLYFLFQCPYQDLYLKPNPSTASETNQLWNWDVAEVFIGSDFENIRRYKEFEVSPQAEWVDLDIDLSKTHPETGWLWNSGFKAAARVDRTSKTWYAAMRIPLKAIDKRGPKEGNEFRVNLYLSEGKAPNHRSLVWRPTLKSSFHIPEKFGILKLGNAQ